MKTRELARGALIGALYVLLTLLFAPISSGLVQVRVAEALCVLPCFTFSAVPGLFVGCLIANLLTGAAPYDVIFGSLATLLAADCTWRMRKAGWSKWLMPLPSVVWNALIVGWLLCYVYAVGVSFPLCALYVGAGQALACYALGMPLMALLGKYGGRLFR
ncbi:MAG: QueT transporter family protein [Clostridia bacterium]|nr:QueT transporter family protein [Clostridia bacterium]